MSNQKKYLSLKGFLKNHDFSLGEGNQLLINSSETELRSLLDELGMESDVYANFAKFSGGDYQFKLTEETLSEFKIYDSKERFLRKITPHKQDQNYLVYDLNKKEFLGFVDGITFLEDDEVENNYFFKNVFLFKKFLKSWEKKGLASNISNEAFRFIDYYNQQNQIFLLSTLDKRVEIKKSQSFKEYSNDLSQNIKLFEKSLQEESKNQLPFFLKKEVIEESNKFSSDEALIELFINFQKVYNRALLNFQIYIHDISIDKLKEEYEEFRKGYLEAFSDVLNKLLIKILSIPLAFGASAFALSKISSSYLIVMLLFGIISTSWIVNMSLVNHFLDLKDISKGLRNKVQKIKEHNFFKENSEELLDLKEIVDHIKGKIRLSIRYIWSYFILTSLITTLFLAYPIKDYFKTFYNKKYEFPTSDLLYVIVLSLIVCYLCYVFYMSRKIYLKSRATRKIRNSITLD